MGDIGPFCKPTPKLRFLQDTQIHEVIESVYFRKYHYLLNYNTLELVFVKSW